MSNNIVSVRDNSIDIAKGIGIILVVVGHCIKCNTYPGIFIYAFHMPLFFLISGLCFNFRKHTEFLPFIISRLRTLILPAVVFTIFDVAISHLIANQAIPWNTFLWNGFTRAKWFLGVLFAVEVLYYCALRLCGDKKKIQLILILLCLVIGISFSKKHIILPYNLSSVFVSTFYYGLGCILRDKIIGNNICCGKEGWSVSLLSMSLFFIITSLVGPGFGMSDNAFSLIDLGPSLLGIITVITFSKIIVDWGGHFFYGLGKTRLL